VQIVHQIMHRSAGLLNSGEQLLAAGQIAAVMLLFMAGILFSHPHHLISSIQFKSDG
jgi:hypothetical protein